MSLRASPLIDCLARLGRVLTRLPHSIKFWHIRRDFNQVADFMANEAMDTDGPVVVQGLKSPLAPHLLKLHNNSLNERIYAQPVNQPVLVVTRSQSAAAPVEPPVEPSVSPLASSSVPYKSIPQWLLRVGPETSPNLRIMGERWTFGCLPTRSWRSVPAWGLFPVSWLFCRT